MASAQHQQKPNRVAHLDGLRGLAILSVIIYHTFGRWPDHTPWGNEFAFIAGYGWAGVQLFFLLSGYVILMTLERCKSPLEFAYRRLKRLWPGMLFCSLAIFILGLWLTYRPEGEVKIIDLLPGLTLIDPFVWGKLGIDTHSLDGSFWSIYVEVLFYGVAALLYFLFKARGVVVGCALLFALSLVGVDNWLINKFSHFGWFASGACFYIAKDNKALIAFALMLALVSCLTLDVIAPGLVVSCLFVLSLYSNRTQRALSQKGLLWFGFISYPLYLLHQNLMVSIIHYAEQLGAFGALCVSIGVVCLLAWVVAKAENKITHMPGLESFSQLLKRPEKIHHIKNHLSL